MPGHTTIKLDDYEYGAVIESLVDERNGLIREQRPTDTIDGIILKLDRAKNPCRKRKDRCRDDAR
jgi:hypothetical protein